MKYRIQGSRKKSLGYAFIILCALLVLSMTSSVITGLLAWHFATTQRTVTTPMVYNQPFSSDAKSGDSNLMSMLATSFVYLRLTVSPETIDNQQKLLLSYVPAASRDAMKKVLDVEAEYIRRNGVTTVFNIADITTLAPGDMLVTGTLSASTTNGRLNTGQDTVPSPLKPEEKTYRLKIQYLNGTPVLQEFSEVIKPSKQK